jgi:hypothetical protein
MATSEWDGNVFNHFGGKEASMDMNKIHQASCEFLHRIQDMGKRTKKHKVCSTTLKELEAHAIELRRGTWGYSKRFQR